MKKKIAVLFLCAFSIITYGQPDGPPDEGMPSEPGKCYANYKNSIITIFDTSFIKHYVLDKSSEKTYKNVKSANYQIQTSNENWIKAYKNSVEEPIWEILKGTGLTKTIDYLNQYQIWKTKKHLIDTIYVEI